MKEYNYFKAPIAVAERIGVAGMRRPAGDGLVILSKSDLRMLDLTIEEKARFFGCEECDEDGALQLIEENKEESPEESREENKEENKKEEVENVEKDVEETETVVREGDNPAEPETMEGEEHE